MSCENALEFLIEADNACDDARSWMRDALDRHAQSPIDSDEFMKLIEAHDDEERCYAEKQNAWNRFLRAKRMHQTAG